ncbi:MAG: hypothetical protein AB1585_03105 [Thermodesulfobacteriota bacterium]
MGNLKVLRPGDLFCSRSKGALSCAIRVVQWFWSTDNESTYNHTGVVANPEGGTVEARWRIHHYRLKDQLGHRVLIARNLGMTPIRAATGLAVVEKDVGCLYPVWRLPLHLLKLSKFFAFGPGVCSELTGKFMAGAGFKNIVYGLTPDDLADRWRIDKDMEVIFEGQLTIEVLAELTNGRWEK